jgi:CrcB protein
MDRVFWIGLTGALGTVTRYLVGLWAGRMFGPAFPWGTFVVNVAGCFFIAAIMHVAMTTSLIPPTLRLSLTTGFLGGLTTYSSFNYETTKFLQEKAWSNGLTNFVLTVTTCFFAGILGIVVARGFVGS